jgi:hypothetical protein
MILSMLSLFNNTKPGANTILTFLMENLGEKKIYKCEKTCRSSCNNSQLEMAANSEIVLLLLVTVVHVQVGLYWMLYALKKWGSPTISICSDRFSTFAHELAKSHGAEDLRILSVKHPVAGLSTEEIRKNSYNFTFT